jgi:hypothetical protein
MLPLIASSLNSALVRGPIDSSPNLTYQRLDSIDCASTTERSTYDLIRIVAEQNPSQ